MSSPALPGPPAPKRSRAVSKRDFLVGLAAGAALIEYTRWVWNASPFLGIPSEPTPLDPGPPGPGMGYGQFQEDIAVRRLMADVGRKVTSYIDIGAYDPVSNNNTYLFYKDGATGVLVEPNPDLYERLTKTRPRDTVLKIGIGTGPTRELADYYRLSEPSWNTFSKEQAEQSVRSSAGRVTIREVVQVPLEPLNDVFARHFPDGAPDFLSIDVEGLDLAILKTIDYTRWRPKVICVETVVPGAGGRDPEAGRLLTANGYLLREQTYANEIFMDRAIVR